MDEISVSLDVLFKKCSKTNKYQIITTFFLFFMFITSDFLSTTIQFIVISQKLKLSSKETEPNLDFIAYKDANFASNTSKKIFSSVSDSQSSLIQIVIFSSMTISGMLTYIPIDKFGRKKMIIIFSCIYSVGLVVVAFKINTILDEILLSIIGLIGNCLVVTIFIYLGEITRYTHMKYFVSVLMMGKPIGGILYASWYHFLLNYKWNLLFFVVLFIHLIFLIFFIIYCVESPLFFITKGYIKSFEETTTEIGKKNGVTMEMTDYSFLLQYSNKRSSGNNESLLVDDSFTYGDQKLNDYQFYDLLRNKSQIATFCTMNFLWFTYHFILKSLDDELKVYNDYSTEILNYSTYIVGYILQVLLLCAFKFTLFKILILAQTLFFAGLCCSVFLSLSKSFSTEALNCSLTVLKIIFSAIEVQLYILALDLYPVTLRSKGFGWNNSIGILGRLLSVVVVDVLKISSLTNVHFALVFLGMVFSMVLPEKKGITIPYYQIPEKQINLRKVKNNKLLL